MRSGGEVRIGGEVRSGGGVRTCEGGDVYDGIHLSQRLRIDQRVGEGESSLSVGVDDLDSLFVGSDKNISGAHRTLAHHVLTRSDDEMNLCIWSRSRPAGRQAGRQASRQAGG